MQTVYVPKESGMLKVHVQNLKSRIFDKVHLKGWKFLGFKWQLKWGTETAFGEPNNKGQQMISTPP